MTILYRGFNGHGVMSELAWMLIAAGAIFLILFIFSIMHEWNDVGASLAFGLAVGFIVCGLMFFKDTRVPIVKAIIDEDITWQEMNKNYELLGNEGDIYKFEVKNVTVEDWEKEIENK